MSNSFLTKEDELNYGSELLDVSQRAALHAVAPHLAGLEQANAELRQRLAIEARRNLDQRVAAAVPNYQEIDRDPRWLQWLRGVDVLTGRARQVLLNDAIASTDANRVAEFFRKFQQEAGGTQSHASVGTTYGRARSSGGRPTYTRPQIAALYERHRRGELVGPEWDRLEVDIIRASGEGRILGGVDVAGK
jgi:hypothetical protein